MALRQTGHQVHTAGSRELEEPSRGGAIGDRLGQRLDFFFGEELVARGKQLRQDHEIAVGCGESGGDDVEIAFDVAEDRIELIKPDPHGSPTPK